MVSGGMILSSIILQLSLIMTLFLAKKPMSNYAILSNDDIAADLYRTNDRVLVNKHVFTQHNRQES